MPEEQKEEVKEELGEKVKEDFFQSINQFILKNEKIILISLLIISLIITIILGFQIKSQWSQDSYWHMSLAKNIFSGKGYTIDGQSPHGKYPPGLSFLILPFLLIFSNVQIAGLILIGILSLLSIFLIYKIGKLISPLVGIISSILLLTHYLWVFNSVCIMTEIPFAFFSICSIFLFIKGFNKKIYFIPSLVFFAISSLIRYDGFLLVFPFAFFLWKNKLEIKQKIKKEFIIGLFLALIIIGAWFLRNWITFGNPFYTDYSSEITTFSFSQAFFFLGLFFKTGYVFPFLSLIGIYFLIKQKNQKINVFFIWFLIYILLHLFWSAKTIRFYVEILPLMCLLSSLGLIGISKILTKNKKKFFTILAILLIIVIAGQAFIFFSGSINKESSIKTLNRYEPIHQASGWANKNLPEEAIYIVPDKAVYNLYLNKKNILYYNQGVNFIFTNKENYSIFIFADTIHLWMTQPFLKGESGQIVLQSKDNMGFLTNLVIETELIDKEDYQNRSEAIILKVKSSRIEKSN